MADYSWVKDEKGNVVGIWLRDPSALNRPGTVETLLVMQNPDLLNVYLAKNYRTVANRYDESGGCFVMFKGSKAPGE